MTSSLFAAALEAESQEVTKRNAGPCFWCGGSTLNIRACPEPTVSELTKRRDIFKANCITSGNPEQPNWSWCPRAFG